MFRRAPSFKGGGPKYLLGDGLLYPVLMRPRPPAVGLLVQVALKPVAASSRLERAALCPRRW